MELGDESGAAPASRVWAGERNRGQIAEAKGGETHARKLF